MENPEQKDLSHHKRLEYCTSRLKYREGRKLTAIKVYTIVNESKHLLVFGVPRINLHQEIKQLFSRYGTVLEVRKVTDQLITNDSVEVEQFTDCFYVKYERVHNARFAKAKVDRKNFYGGVLHVSYGPEYESVADVREKFNCRRRDVLKRLKNRKTPTNPPHKRMFDESVHEPQKKT